MVVLVSGCIDSLRYELVHCAEGPGAAEILGVSAVGETCEERVIEGKSFQTGFFSSFLIVEFASGDIETAVVLNVYRKPVHFGALPEAEFTCDFPISPDHSAGCSTRIVAAEIVHIHEKECASE